MAKRIASAVGTEMQFMPQPDATYQERLTEVQGVRGTNPSSSSASMFASAANNLNSSWLSFITDREKSMNEEGLTEANRLIASTTEEDRQNLNFQTNHLYQKFRLILKILKYHLCQNYQKSH